MHELGVVCEVLKTVQEIVDEQKLSKVENSDISDLAKKRIV